MGERVRVDLPAVGDHRLDAAGRQPAGRVEVVQREVQDAGPALRAQDRPRLLALAEVAVVEAQDDRMRRQRVLAGPAVEDRVERDGRESPPCASAATWARRSAGETQRPAYVAPGGAGAITWYISTGTGAREWPRRCGRPDAGRWRACSGGAGAALVAPCPADGEDEPQPAATTTITINNGRSARRGTRQNLAGPYDGRSGGARRVALRGPCGVAEHQLALQVAGFRPAHPLFSSRVRRIHSPSGCSSQACVSSANAALQRVEQIVAQDRVLAPA